MGPASTDKPLQINIIEISADHGSEEDSGRFYYTKMLLKTALQLMGCKTRIAHKVSRFAHGRTLSTRYDTL